jgi:hypothetical protein
VKLFAVLLVGEADQLAYKPKRRLRSEPRSWRGENAFQVARRTGDSDSQDDELAPTHSLGRRETCRRDVCCAALFCTPARADLEFSTCCTPLPAERDDAMCASEHVVQKFFHEGFYFLLSNLPVGLL